MVYSVSPINVTLERPASASMKTRSVLTYTTVVNQTRVALKVFNSDVDADGFIAVIQLSISSQEEFGKYKLVIENNIMPAAIRSIEIVPEGTVSFFMPLRSFRLD